MNDLKKQIIGIDNLLRYEVYNVVKNKMYDSVWFTIEFNPDSAWAENDDMARNTAKKIATERDFSAWVIGSGKRGHINNGGQWIDRKKKYIPLGECYE